MAEHVSQYHLEGIQRLSSKIMTPEQFDARVREDEAFREQISGFNSQSLGVLAGGVEGSAFRFPLYGNVYPQINIELTESCYMQTFDTKANYPHPAVGKSVQKNREYGRTNTLHELLASHAILTPLHVEKVLREIGDIGILETFFATAQGARSLQEILNEIYSPGGERNLRLPADGNDDSDIQRATRIALELGLDANSVAEIEKAMQERSGVQVIFGLPERFAAFLRQNNAEAVDDFAASVTAPIPEGLILAIIPLGGYEKRALLGATPS